MIDVGEDKTHMKPGLRLNLRNLAKAKGPQLSEVQTRLRDLIKDRVVVGYHTMLKLSDLGVLPHELSLEDYANIVDCSIKFNEDGSHIQQQIKQLCKD